MYANNNTIKMLMKLFEIRIVANNFCGVFNNSTTIFFVLNLDSDALFISSLESEKKATSAPEIKADKANNKKSANTLESSKKSILLLINNIRKNMGSGSKLISI